MKVQSQSTTRGPPVPTYHICAVCLLGPLVLPVCQSLNSPECVLQVVASGQGNGAEETLNSRNCVQEQRLWEVLWRDTTDAFLSITKRKNTILEKILYCRWWWQGLDSHYNYWGEQWLSKTDMKNQKICVQAEERCCNSILPGISTCSTCLQKCVLNLWCFLTEQHAEILSDL